MKQILEVLVFVFIGVVLLWFGYTVFFKGARGKGGISARGRGGSRRKQAGLKSRSESSPGEPKTCLVCSAILKNGEQISTVAFPSMNGGKDRFMHIRGCVYCLRGERDRVCPVCGIILRDDEVLICRLYERLGRRSHVHVLGCTQCRGPSR